MKKIKTVRFQGFSLVEMMVALAVLGILASIAIPAYSTMVLSHNLASQANSLLTSLHLARSEAIKRNARVVACKSASGMDCTGSGSWQQGWIVFEDTNNNASLDDEEILLRRIQALPAGYSLTGNAPVARYVSYTPLGLTKMTSGAFQAGTLTLCHPSAGNGEARQIVINISGRPRIQKVALASCPLASATGTL